MTDETDDIGGGVYLDVEDFDQHYFSLQREPIIANEWNVDAYSSRSDLNDLLVTRYDSDSLDATPSCDCGTTVVSGAVCHVCGTVAVVPAEKPIESRVWIRAPEGVLGMINPIAWLVLEPCFVKDNNHLLTWLVDPHYRPPNPNSEWLVRLEELGFKRGLNYFIENFDTIMDVLIKTRAFTGKRKDELDKLQMWIERNRTKLFPQQLPIPCKITFIIESLDIGTSYGDLKMKDALDALRTIQGLYSGIDTQPSQQTKESRTAKASMQLANFYKLQYRWALGPKAGWFRRHVFGSRPAFSFRAVITSISEVHEYDDCHLPWSLAISLFKMHLHNKLAKRGFTPLQATQFIAEKTLKYDPLMEELLNELIREAPGRGPVIVLQRNPSLKRLSAQRLFVTRIKNDPKINTISLSVLVLKGPNADFDGLKKLSLNPSNCWELLRALLATAVPALSAANQDESPDAIRFKNKQRLDSQQRSAFPLSYY